MPSDNQVSTVILCGGKGTRLREETKFKPKPLILIGKKPIIWHIMKIYQYYGFNKFILPLGYKGKMIKDYFSKNNEEGFEITFVETGLESLTGERILKVERFIKSEDFMLTYGDGVSDINIQNIFRRHKDNNTIATITGIPYKSKFGIFKSNKKNITSDFKQKPILDDYYINGGFMVFKKEVMNYFTKGTIEDSFAALVEKKQISLFKHKGFWGAIDTYPEMIEMNNIWKNNKPWAVWEKNKLDVKTWKR